jgi:alkylated DNA repair dioxygenase AlkB
MSGLFPDEILSAPPAIPGLNYLRDYLSERDEQNLVAAVDAEPWDETWDRRRQPYGVSYGRRKGKELPIPVWGVVLIDRLHREGVGDWRFDQMLVNEYATGQGISFHRDYDPFDRTVVSLSLLAPCVMEFRRVSDGLRESMLLEPRSLLILEDEARYEWEHGIARRKSDHWAGAVIPRRRRLSVTFRMLKQRS